MASKRRQKGRSPGVRIVHPQAAGVDIGSDRHWVAVTPDLDADPVRSFRSFTGDLHALADWLERCGVESVAMESTGVYWIPLYELLEARGFEVFLVDARHARNVPGRKSDVLDCQWIEELHRYGLLRASFRPEEAIVRMRAYLRQRERLVQMGATHIQHMQKALSQMNLQLHNVISDITGKTGLQILRAIVEGERAPKQLARFRDPRCRASREVIAASLEGHYREEHVFALQQALELYDVCQEKIAACDAQIARTLTALAPDEAPVPLPAAPRSARKPRGNEPRFEIRDPLFRLTGGVDLSQIDGLGPYSALRLVSEIGLDLSRWPTFKHFASWLRLAPGTKISGGKRLDRRTPPGAPRAATILRQAATTLRRTDTALGAFYRRMAARVGAGKAVVATARKLAGIVYDMLTTGRPYQPQTSEAYDLRNRERVRRALQRRAQALGYRLVPQAPLGVS